LLKTTRAKFSTNNYKNIFLRLLLRYNYWESLAHSPLLLLAAAFIFLSGSGGGGRLGLDQPAMLGDLPKPSVRRKITNNVALAVYTPDARVIYSVQAIWTLTVYAQAARVIYSGNLLLIKQGKLQVMWTLAVYTQDARVIYSSNRL